MELPNESNETSSEVEVKLQDESTVQAGNLEVEENNPGFDSIIEDATKTQAQEKVESQASKGAGHAFTNEQAAGIALGGLNAAIGLASGFTKTQIVVAKEFQMLFAAMTTPVVLKYGATIKKLLEEPSDDDLNSYIPEALAAAACIGIAIPSYMQVKEQKSIQSLPIATEDKQPQPEVTTAPAAEGVH